MRRALSVIVLVLIALPAAYAAKPKPKPVPKPPACPNDASLGRIAYARDGALHVVTLGRCRDRVLVPSGVTGPVRYSADGEYISFGGGVVKSAGGRVTPNHGVWGPLGHVLARITRGGGVIVGAHRILPDGWGAASVLWTPQGNLVVARSRYPRKPYRQEIWIWFQDTGNLQLVAGAFRGFQRPDLVGVTRDGSWVFWWVFGNSESLNADGVPLNSKRMASGTSGPRIAPSMLGYSDYVTWCGNRLVVVSGGSRLAIAAKSLVVASPPGFRVRPLVDDPRRAWASPTCSLDNRIAVLSQPATTSYSAKASWSLWTVDLKGARHRLLSPPKGQSYESPKWLPDGSILFVRRTAKSRGQLMLYRNQELVGPITDLGYDPGYYGHHNWWSAADWHS